MNREAMKNTLINYCNLMQGCDNCLFKNVKCAFKDMTDDELAQAMEAYARNQVPASTITDNVNHPQHYELPGGLECFDVIVATQGVEAAKHFCLCNAMKYLFRSQRKNGAEDIEKARWYLNKHHDLTESGGDTNG